MLDALVEEQQLNSQHSVVGSQPFVTLVLDGPMPFFDLSTPGSQAVHI